jgi:hypothetical protein
MLPDRNSLNIRIVWEILREDELRVAVSWCPASYEDTLLKDGKNVFLCSYK